MMKYYNYTLSKYILSNVTVTILRSFSFYYFALCNHYEHYQPINTRLHNIYMTRIIHQSLNTKNLFSSSLYLKATFDNIHLFYFLVIHAFGHLQIYAEIFTFPNKCSNYKNSDVHTRNSFPFCISTFQRFMFHCLPSWICQKREYV